MTVLSPTKTDTHKAWPVGSGADELSTYLEYNKVLRSWFVAFGVGGPALFLINPAIAKTLVSKGELTRVSILFLLGAAFQVAGALINKACNWYVYRGANDRPFQDLIRYKVSMKLVRQFWIDLTLDVLTIIAYGLATWDLLMVFAAG